MALLASRSYVTFFSFPTQPLREHILASPDQAVAYTGWGTQWMEKAGEEAELELEQTPMQSWSHVWFTEQPVQGLGDVTSVT